MSKDPKLAATVSNVATGGGSDFETAIEACGIGCFNIGLIIASLFTAISVLYTTSSLSFVMPIAECELNLSLMDKGYLNAMSFAGIVTSAIPWGYVADTIGRKVVLVYALILDGIVVSCSGLSPSFLSLLVLKFIDGFLICGPFAVIMSYVSEFHGMKQRARVMLIVGMNFSFAATSLPILAVCILPTQWTLEIFSLKINTWQIFILVTAIAPLIGGFYDLFFPESPKFLMSQGRNAEALECLRTIYAVNYRKPKSEYPITSLVDEAPEKAQQLLKVSSLEYKAAHSSMADKAKHAKEQFYEGLRQLRPMFSSPYLIQSIQVYTMEFCVLLGLNSLRLWLPEIFVTFEDFAVKNMTNCDICTILDYISNKPCGEPSDSSPKNSGLHINIKSYSDNIIVAVASFFFYLLAAIVINKIGNNMVLKISLCLGFLSGMGMYFSNSRLMVLILASVYVSVMCVAATNVTTAAVNLFPTQMRTMVILTMMTFGRFGSLLGNILFPLFIPMGCMPPFLLIAGVIIVAFILSLFLPHTTHVVLK